MPALIFAITAWIVFLAGPQRYPRFVKALAILAALMTLFVAWFMGKSPLPVSASWEWRTPLGESGLFLWVADVPATWGLMLLSWLALAGALLLPTRLQPGQGRGIVVGLAMLSAVGLFAVADNLLTLSAAWLLLDGSWYFIALMRRHRYRSIEVTMQVLAALILWGSIFLGGLAGAILPWRLASITPGLLILFLLLAWLGSGGYPINFSMLAQSGTLPTPWLMAKYVAGLILLFRVMTLSVSWQVDALAAWSLVTIFLGTGLAAWVARRSRDRLALLLTNRLAFLFLIVLLVPGQVSLWLTSLTLFVFGAALLLIWPVGAYPVGVHVIRGVTAFLLFFLPGFHFFFSLHHINSLSMLQPPVIAWLAIIVGQLLAGASLTWYVWPQRAGGREEKKPWRSWSLLAAVLLLFVALTWVPVLVGARPFWFIRLHAWPLLLTDTLLLLGALLLGSQEKIILRGTQGWRWGIVRITFLVPLIGPLRQALQIVADWFEQMTLLVEGEGYFGWVLLFLLLAAIFWQRGGVFAP